MKKIPLMLSSALLIFSTFANADTTQAINYDHNQFVKTKELYMLSQANSKIYVNTSLTLDKDKKNDPIFSSRKPEWNGSVLAIVTLPNCASFKVVKSMKDSGINIKSYNGDITIAAFKTIVKNLDKMGAKYMLISWQDQDANLTSVKTIKFSDYLQKILTSPSVPYLNTRSFKVKEVGLYSCRTSNMSFGDFMSIASVIGGAILGVHGASTGNMNITNLGTSTMTAGANTATIKANTGDNGTNSSGSDSYDDIAGPFVSQIFVYYSGINDLTAKYGGARIMAKEVVEIKDAKEVLSHYMDVDNNIIEN